MEKTQEKPIQGFKVALSSTLQKRVEDWNVLGELLYYLQVSHGLISNNSEEDNKLLREKCAQCKGAIHSFDMLVDTVITALDCVEEAKEE